MIKGLKIKFKEFWGLFPTFVEVTGKKTGRETPLTILNRIKQFIKRTHVTFITYINHITYIHNSDNLPNSYNLHNLRNYTVAI